MIEEWGKQNRNSDLFHNDPFRVLSCTAAFSMRRGPTPRLIIFANVIDAMIHLCVHDRNRSAQVQTQQGHYVTHWGRRAAPDRRWVWRPVTRRRCDRA